MFEYLNELVRMMGSDATELSRKTLKASARSDAMLELLNTDPQLHITRAAYESGFDKLLISGSRNPMLYLAGPYPEYPFHSPNMADTSRQMNDHRIVRDLLDNKPFDLNNTLRWVMEISKRPDVKDMYKGDDTALAAALQKASIAAAGERKEIIDKECRPILERIMPDAVSGPELGLKKALGRHLFKEQGTPESTAERMAITTVSSIKLTSGVANAVIKRGSKVILPIPYFDPFPVIMEAAGAKVITPDTTKTNFKLKADDLLSIVKDNSMGEGDWLFLTCPNNANMMPYTRQEMQAIADVVAQTGIRVICDELYAHLDNDKAHVPLASLTGYGPNGPVDMKDKVITVTGCSKQFPFGSEHQHKLGAAVFPMAEEARQVQEVVNRSTRVSQDSAIMFKALLDSTPGRLRDECCRLVQKNVLKIKDAFDELNGRFAAAHPDNDSKGKAFEIVGSDSGYLACLKLSPELCEKAGIRDSDELAAYLFATAGIYTKSLAPEGVTEPMVRFNVNEISHSLSKAIGRLEAVANAIQHGSAPPMAVVNQKLNELMHNSARTISYDMYNQARRS